MPRRQTSTTIFPSRSSAGGLSDKGNNCNREPGVRVWPQQFHVRSLIVRCTIYKIRVALKFKAYARSLLHQDLRLPDERVRLHPHGGCARCRRRTDSRRQRTVRGHPADEHLLGARQAEDKVYSLLGTWRLLKAQRRASSSVWADVLPARKVRRSRRARLTWIWSRSTDHPSPAATAGRPAAHGSIADRCEFPEIEKFDHLPAPRASGAAAFVSIMEGCSKFCSYLRRAVHARRGSQSSGSLGAGGSAGAGGAGRRRDHIAGAECQRPIEGARPGAARWIWGN